MKILKNFKGQRAVRLDEPDGSFSFHLVPRLSDVDDITLVCPYCGRAYLNQFPRKYMNVTELSLNDGVKTESKFNIYTCDKCSHDGLMPMEIITLDDGSVVSIEDL